MKRLFSLGVALLLSIGVMPLSAADWVSLDDLVKAAGCTPVIDGGTSNTHYPSSCPPSNAFDGITFATDNSYRWLGNLQKNTYLKYAIPDDFQMPFQIRGYRVHALSAGDYWRDRAPTAWELYGHTDADAAVDDEGWMLLDAQTDVVWPFTVSGASTSDPASFTLEFTVSDSLHYNAYKFVPTASNRASTDSWTVGLKELVFLGETVAPTGSLVIQSTPENLGSTSPAYGVVEGLDSGMTVDVSAEELAYTDTIRYACSGYCTEVLQADGTWLMETTNLGVRAFTYVSDGQVRRLTWLWEENGYKLTTGVESGLESVTASPAAESDGYYAAGTRVTLIPVCATDPVSYFKNWYGDIPADATAEGCSPQARSLRPKLVLYRRKNDTPHTTRQIQVVQYVRQKNSGPITGIFDSRGMSERMMPRRTVTLPLPVMVCARNSVRAVASMLIAVPDMTWLLLRLIAAKACSIDRRPPAAIAARMPTTIAAL